MQLGRSSNLRKSQAHDILLSRCRGSHSLRVLLGQGTPFVTILFCNHHPHKLPQTCTYCSPPPPNSPPISRVCPSGAPYSPTQPSPKAAQDQVELLSCGGDCILRSVTVRLWSSCKYSLGWPTTQPKTSPPVPKHSSAPAASAAATGQTPTGWEKESPLQLAVRWGELWEVRSILELIASQADIGYKEEPLTERDYTNPKHALVPALGEAMRQRGSLRRTVIHEAALRADIRVLQARQ